jgi:hypothetical protein
MALNMLMSSMACANLTAESGSHVHDAFISILLCQSVEEAYNLISAQIHQRSALLCFSKENPHGCGQAMDFEFAPQATRRTLDAVHNQ